jgi:2-keto-4-pentenoate hydratase/2-oxohepta-3-ene-1,7-dioic acid hydratase in catechol pathway
MKFACFQFGPDRYWGQIDEEHAHAWGRIARDAPHTVNDAIGRLHERIARSDSRTFPRSKVRLGAPVPAPQKIICVGRNYAEHASEMGANVGELPVIFNKLPSCVVGPADTVRLPAESDSVDYEGELVAVIGRAARRVAAADAQSHVFGYCCGNDITARDWQKGGPGGQWLLGKSFDTFAPIGPWIVTADEIAPGQLELQTRLNGEVVQQASTRQLMFTIDFVISHVSRFCTLVPGDLIFTGTPSGVGAGRQPPVFLKHGDRLEVEINGIGCLQNDVQCESGCRD